MSDHDETRPIQPTDKPADPTPDAPEQPAPQPGATAYPQQPAPPPPAATAYAAQPVPPPPRTRLRDRSFGLTALVASTAAALLLGGLGGAGIAALVDGDDRPDVVFHRFGGPGLEHFDRDFDGPFGERGFPPMPPDELPESTTPDDEESEPSPSDGETSPSST